MYVSSLQQNRTEDQFRSIQEGLSTVCREKVREQRRRSEADRQNVCW